MPGKVEKPLFYLVSKDGRYFVYRNDTPEGTPTGRSAPSCEDGQKIISELEKEAKKNTPSTTTKSCPRCGKTGEIAREFGYRKTDGKERAQSYCRDCRTTPAHLKADGTTDAKTTAGNTPKFQATSQTVCESNAAPTYLAQNKQVEAKLQQAPSYPEAVDSPTQATTTGAHRRKAADTEADKAVRLFKFLRELTLLRTKTVRSLEKYESVIWFHDFPQLAGCFSVFLRAEDERSDLLLEVERPVMKLPPSLPTMLQRWVDEASLKDSTVQPTPKSVVATKTSDDVDIINAEITYDHFANYPDLQGEWDDYVQTEWQPWAVSDRKNKEVLDVYERLFDIYQSIQKTAENWELLLCTGLLTWKTSSGHSVCRHILTAVANITFDSTRGIVSLLAPSEGIRFKFEEDMLELSERPAIHHKRQLEQLLGELNEEPFSDERSNRLLQTWVQAMSARGTYSNQQAPDFTPGDDPSVIFAPAIIFRERTERDLVRLFEEIIQNIAETKELPLGVERLVSILDDKEIFSDFESDEAATDQEIYFPREANAEQREIAEKIRQRQGVLVQGPPGTGKSHTIANLVCHLLATGKRILVTSHTPRALAVLRDKFPDDMKALCVSVIGDDSTETRKALEQSVAGITSKRNQFDERLNRRLINDLNTTLQEMRAGEAWTLNALRAIREADTYSHPTKFDSYNGTTQSIARRVKAEEADYAWLHVSPPEDVSPPLTNEEALEFLVASRKLPEEKVKELSLHCIDVAKLPDPQTFTDWLSQQTNLNGQFQKLDDLKNHSAYAASAKLDPALRKELVADLGSYVNALQRLLNRRESWVAQAATEIVSDRDRPWRNLHAVTHEKLKEIGPNYTSILSVSISGMDGKDLRVVKAHAVALSEHLQKKGGLGFGPFKPKPVKDASYLIAGTLINGRPGSDPFALSSLIEWLDVQLALAVIKDNWQGKAEFSHSNPLGQIAEVEDFLEPLEQGFELHAQMLSLRQKLQQNPSLGEPRWDELEDLRVFTQVLECGEVEERLAYIQQQLADLDNELKVAASHPNAHPALQELLIAFQAKDHERYHDGYNKLELLSSRRALLNRKQALGAKLSKDAASVCAEIESGCDDPGWDGKLSNFQGAWNWARARAWVENVSRPDAQRELAKQLETTQADIRRTLGQLAAAKAWEHTFRRLTESQHSHLIAWEMAVKRIGKGTGKYAEKHRKSARKHMEECRSAIPAWIMPIHRVVETTKLGGEPFDVVIIDEASQSGPEALFLMYIAKQIVVVGDDKQISPEFVGQNRAEVDSLRDLYLKDIPFDDALGVDNSFFDQAKIRYRGSIRLKEHFRCMPEIIQFSNNLCYTDDPLIPLRQYGAGRLTPVIQTRYIQTGNFDEEARKAVNIPEAEAILEQIKACCADPAYDGKTMGVISLLNKSGQAEYIEKRLKSGSVVSKEEIEARKLRVGDSYVFQGDERDVIFLSMVSAPRIDAKQLHPMTLDKDNRRFNVAASRARDQVWLFHSVSLADLNKKCVRYKLLEYYSNPNVAMTEVGETDIETLKRQLETAYSGAGTPPKPFDSWFEVDVFLRIASRGYRVIPQYFMNGYYIDLVVEGIKGRLAVECDGDTWHGPDRYEHDVSRQRDLERCGMHFCRIRGSAFYLNPERALSDLWTELNRMEIYPSIAEAQHHREPSVALED